MTRYFVGEQPTLVGKFLNGDTVTITIYKLPSTLVVTDQSCTQIGTTGYFRYVTLIGDIAPTTFEEYIWYMTNGTYEVAGSFIFDGYHTADSLLKRDMSAVDVAQESRNPLQAFRFLRNKWSISGTTLTVTEEDDATMAWTGVLETTEGANPVTGCNPTGP